MKKRCLACGWVAPPIKDEHGRDVCRGCDSLALVPLWYEEIEGPTPLPKYVERVLLELRRRGAA